MTAGGPDLRRVLVTGGSGFIGRHVVERLVERGCDVFVLDRSRPEGCDATFLPVDIRDREGVGSAVARAAPDAVVHLAAVHFIPYCLAHPAETRATNVYGTANLLEAARVCGSARVVFASTAAVYQETRAPHREGDRLRPHDGYGRSKLHAEGLVARHGRTTGAGTVIVRIFNVYGPRATNPHLIPSVVSQARDGGVVRVGNLAPRRDYVYVEDVATALTSLALDVDVDVTVNVGTGRSTSVAEVVRLVAARVGRHLDIVSDPARARADDPLHLEADIGRLTKLLAWAPATTLEQGIDKLVPVERTPR